MDVDEVGLWQKAIVPDVFQQHVAGHHAVGPAHQVFEQLEFAFRKIDLTVPTPNGSNANLVSVKLDGTTVVDSKPLMVPLQGGLPTVRVGIGSVTTTNPETAWDVFYDNVIINVQKI